EKILKDFIEAIGLRNQIDKLRYKNGRREIWTRTRQIRMDLHKAIQDVMEKTDILQRLTGLALTTVDLPEGVRLSRDGMPVFAVQALREARRQRDDGRVLNQVFITILQKETLEHQGRKHVVRCGSTLILDLDQLRVTYVVRKGLRDKERLARTIAFKEAR